MNRHGLFASTLGGALACALPVQAATETAAPSLATLLHGAQTALDECLKQGFHVTVTVIGEDLVARVVLRDARASDHGVEVSRRKAYTAAKTGLSSRDFGLTLPPDKRIMPPPGYTGPFPPPGPVKEDATLDPSPGGLPIVIDGKRIGAIAVSGAPNGDQDEICARRGLIVLIEEFSSH